MPIYRLN
ncbi:hypothetical protein CGLO_15196 [Colletotrichum gloeosporioides Cg-14]|nr:hypothetical protein CGLO_15196 [Colletotrichum gloeosporioides Cg-14]